MAYKTEAIRQFFFFVFFTIIEAYTIHVFKRIIAASIETIVINVTNDKEIIKKKNDIGKQFAKTLVFSYFMYIGYRTFMHDRYIDVLQNIIAIPTNHISDYAFLYYCLQFGQ